MYDANQTSVLKTSLTEYNWTSAYLSRRIIGLPTKSELYDENNALMSKVTYAYDEGDFSDASLNQNLSSAVQHDNTNYGSGFIIGRGNLTSTTRWDVTGQTASVTSNVKYNTAGAAVAQITPGSTSGTTRQVKIDYTDSFNDGANRNTFAYPSRLTDPAGNFSEVKYRYDIGANVWAKSPAPANNTSGKETSRLFDSVGRLERQTVLNNGAYSRYEYPLSGVQSKVFATITSGAGEALSESWTDGAGRVRQSRTELPNSAGGWTGTLIEYDILGQVKRQSVPTEVDGSWSPAGDDQTRGWLWTSQEYDWKGRVTKTVNTDGTDKLVSYEGCGCAGGQVTTVQGELVPRDDQPTLSARRTQKAYADIQGRMYKTEALNWDASVYSTTRTTFDGRDQATMIRQYAGADTSSTFQDSTAQYDGHGRTYKTHKPEQQNADGSPAYTTYNYNNDDSIQSVADARSAVKTYTYNNRGLVTGINSALPIADTLQSGQSLSAGQFITSLNGVYKLIYQTDGNLVLYNTTTNAALWTIGVTSGAPGSMQMQTDGNLVVYNSYGTAVWQSSTNNGDSGTRLVVQDDGNTVLYRSDNTPAWSTNTHGQAAALPPLNTSVAFEYDAAGNRTSMTDGLGSVAYEYDQLSQMTAETRAFNDYLPNAPQAGNSFRLEYTYSLGGQMQSYKDPYGQQINYTQDKIGRLTSVAGSAAFGGVTNYANSPQYTAWGGLKGLSYGNGTQMQTTFNNRLQANHYELNKTGQPNSIMSKSYDYYADRSLQKLTDAVDNRFDRLNAYDNLGRIKTGKSGAEARGGAVAQADMETQLPYRQSYEYNAFNNMTQRNNLHWGIDFWQGESNNLNYTYQNNRITNGGWVYDADGRVLTSGAPDSFSTSVYDASGRLVLLQAESSITRYYTGDGREGKRRKQAYTGTANIDETSYYIRSSVFGGEVVSETDRTGRKKKTYVRAAGATLAWQTAFFNPTNNTQSEYVNFEHWDASGLSYRSTTTSGDAIQGEGAEGAPAELDPLGGNVGLSTPYIQIAEEPPPPVEPEYPSLRNLFEESPMMVNGQKVTATLDGMEISWSSLRSMAGGDALAVNLYNSKGQIYDQSPVQLINGTLSFVSSVTLRQPYDRRLEVVSYRITSIDVSWGSQPQTQQQTRQQETQMTETDPCDISDLNIPPGVSLAKNITEAESHNMWGFLKRPVGEADWFYNKVKNADTRLNDVKTGKSWDYKQLDKATKGNTKSAYEDFGNFNYGATGMAVGFYESQLLQEAGRASLASAKSEDDRKKRENEWGTPGVYGLPLTGTKSYGDDPADQELISRGANYYRNGCHKK